MMTQRQAPCPKCQQTVAVCPALGNEELAAAIERKENIRIYHLAEHDHAWLVTCDVFLALKPWGAVLTDCIGLGRLAVK